jgi:hypothetical protein
VRRSTTAPATNSASVIQTGLPRPRVLPWPSSARKDQVGVGALVGEGQHQSPRPQHGGQGDDEGGEAGAGHQQAVDDADQAADQEGQQQRHQGPVPGAPGREDAAEREQGADGQVDTAGDDDEGHAERDDREERRTRGHVGDVVAGGERVEAERGDDRDDHQHRQRAVLLDQRAQPFGAGGADRSLGVRGRVARGGHGRVRVRDGHRFPRPRAA